MSAAAQVASTSRAPAVPVISDRSLMARLDTQPRVRDFLARALAQGRVSHAYLFVGAPGTGKLDAAWALAQALLCEKAPKGAASGCGACDACVRVARHTHPDVRLYQPESATGYLIDQIRGLLGDVNLAPIRGSSKVYIIDRAEQLRANAANALLKTLEEPPSNVTFILLGTGTDIILPTIVSRCQCVPFRMLSTDESVSAVERATGLPAERCRMAVAVAGSPARAIEFLRSAERAGARRAMVSAIDSLAHADEADILASAKQVMEAVRAPLADVEEAQKAMLGQNSDYLSRGALKQLEERNRRELFARERSGMMEALASARSLLRDALLACEGAEGGAVNTDAADVVGRLSSGLTVAAATRALDAVATAESRIERNVTPQLAVEVMLFDIRKALKCL